MHGSFPVCAYASLNRYAAVGGLFNRGDTPEGCARRELLEETGLVTDELINLGGWKRVSYMYHVS